MTPRKTARFLRDGGYDRPGRSSALPGFASWSPSARVPFVTVNGVRSRSYETFGLESAHLAGVAESNEISEAYSLRLVVGLA